MNERKLASLKTRALGGALDIAILLVLSFVVCFIWALNAHPSEAYLSNDESQILWQSRFILTWLVIELVYCVGLMTSDMQATFGQKAVGIKIVQDSGEKLEIGAAAGRYVVSIFSSIFLKIGYLIAFAREDKKTLHDLVAGTVVIESEASFEPTISNYEQPTKPRTSSAERTVNETVAKDTTKPNFEYAKRKIMDDDSLWAAALEEFESKSRVKGLYAKLYTQHDGNEQRIKSQYIKERFEQLKKEQKEIQAAEEVRAKEKFELLQKQQLEKKIKESALERTINGKTNLVKSIRGIDCYIYEDGRVAIKVEEHRYRLYVDLETAEESINYFKLGNKNYFDEEMRYLPNGFIGWITIDNDKKIISCPRCSQKTRVPSNKELEITCPSCKFQWREKT
jgi:uncharacterized RDD family membrane protein YckC